MRADCCRLSLPSTGGDAAVCEVPLRWRCSGPARPAQGAPEVGPGNAKVPARALVDHAGLPEHHPRARRAIGGDPSLTIPRRPFEDLWWIILRCLAESHPVLK
jgi:hypothetical protein